MAIDLSHTPQADLPHKNVTSTSVSLIPLGSLVRKMHVHAGQQFADHCEDHFSRGSFPALLGFCPIIRAVNWGKIAGHPGLDPLKTGRTWVKTATQRPLVKLIQLVVKD